MTVTGYLCIVGAPPIIPLAAIRDDQLIKQFVFTKKTIPVSEENNTRQKEIINTFLKVKNNMLKSCRNPRHKQYRLGPVSLQFQAPEAFSQRRSEDGPGRIDKV